MSKTLKHNDRRAPISVCMIVGLDHDGTRLNECARALHSVRAYVREIVLVLTARGPDLAFERLARKYADIWEYCPEALDENGQIDNFALARNKSFELATQPWRMWLDSDDVVVHPEELVGFIAPKDSQATWVYCDYVVPPTRIHRERIFYDPYLHWKKRVHEFPAHDHPVRGDTEGAFDADVFTLKMKTMYVYHDPGKRGADGVGNDRNVRIIRKMLAENPKDLHALYELGRHGLERCEFDIALDAFGQWLMNADRVHLDMNRGREFAQFYEASVWLMMAECHAAKMDSNGHNEAMSYVSENRPLLANGWRGLAWNRYVKGEWKSARGYAEAAILKAEVPFLQSLLRGSAGGPNSKQMMQHIIKVCNERLNAAKP